MPELPEVETVVRGLEPRLTGRMIARVRVHWPRTVAISGGGDGKGFAPALSGRRVRRVFRRGKYVCLHLDDDSVLTIHLGMSGQLGFAIEPGRRRHLRLEMEFDDGTGLFFVDPRKFGRAKLWAAGEPLLPGLGIEPLEEKAVARTLRAAASRRAIKTYLLDQSALAGVGNIYADESLFLARIHPLTPAASLTPAQCRRLGTAVAGVLRSAIANQGTTLRDYRTAGGEPGANQENLRVYGRTGRPCPACRRSVVRLVINGRSSHFCPRCQRKRPGPAGGTRD
jgi:formamidopyrimidine-DNA glycosylase